ncbi:hypothetical protein U1Q18_044305 [Sarracenia purpurea var. burkii]
MAEKGQTTGISEVARDVIDLSSDGNTTTSILTFVPGKDDAGKRLSCKAENPHVNQDILDTGWNLQINCK